MFRLLTTPSTLRVAEPPWEPTRLDLVIFKALTVLAATGAALAEAFTVKEDERMFMIFIIFSEI